MMARDYDQEKRLKRTPAIRKLDAKRHRDRYNHEKANGPIPKGKELHHTGSKPATGKTKVISATANRRKQPATKKRGAARGKA